MRKVWTYKRKGIKGWWVGWYESGKRKAKALPTKTLAEHYCQINKFLGFRKDLLRTGLSENPEVLGILPLQKSSINAIIQYRL